MKRPSPIVRAATAADVPLYTRLFPELGVDDPPPTLARVTPLLPRMLIADESGVARGFAVAGLEAGVGFLRQIVVDPAARRRGLGRALVAACQKQLRAQGARRLRLNVKEDNRGAIALYERAGLHPDFRSAALWMTHTARRRMPGSRAPLVVFTPGEVHDAEIEARFSLGEGQLAHLRSGADAVRAVRAAGAGPTLGVMRFSAAYPGAYPFCARHASAARALLGEIEQIVPGAARYGLVVERDEALVTALCAAGAVLRFRMLQMAGPL
jgi:GNAT superfamily N-acetyltransferase